MMTELNQVYKCNVCNNIVIIIHAGKGELVCCGQPMELMVEKTEDAGKEKHVPVVVPGDGETIVKVGSIPHPMEEKHYIEWVEVTVNGVIEREFLKPGAVPEAKFCSCGDVSQAREYCNIHGLWKSVK
jgi:superoxide reductase